MIAIRPAAARGYADHGWLVARHSFSFADYYDPAEMGWGVLRVINEDQVAPAQGFPMHGHRDMEIVTWLLAGELAHKDSLGNGGTLVPGEVQVMSAGRGILHSEFNASPSSTCHLLQIWIEPAQRGGQSRYAQQAIAAERWQQGFVPIASGDGREGSLTIGQDAVVSVARLAAGQTLALPAVAGRKGYLQIARGALTLHSARPPQNSDENSGQISDQMENFSNYTVQQGDGVKIDDETKLSLTAQEASEVVFFDLPF